MKRKDAMLEKMRDYREIVMDAIDYDALLRDIPQDRDRVDEMLELIVETVCTSKPFVRVAGADYPAEVVRSRLLKLDGDHIRFVLDCMWENTTKVRNIKQYLLTALYNAPATIGNYYTSRVQHDFYGDSPHGYRGGCLPFMAEPEEANAGPGNAENADVTVDTALPAGGCETGAFVPSPAARNANWKPLQDSPRQYDWKQVARKSLQGEFAALLTKKQFSYTQPPGPKGTLGPAAHKANYEEPRNLAERDTTREHISSRS